MEKQTYFYVGKSLIFSLSGKVFGTEANYLIAEAEYPEGEGEEEEEGEVIASHHLHPSPHPLIILPQTKIHLYSGSAVNR